MYDLIVIVVFDPDLTVFGEGKLKVKAGLAAIISDALKKNTVQIGFLLVIVVFYPDLTVL